MKKIHSLIIVTLFMTYCTHAQISVGLKAGVNLSSLKGDGYSDSDQKSLLGLAIGGLVNYAINDKFSVQPELFFSQEGTQWKTSDEVEKNRLNYLNIPVLLQYRDPSGFFAQTGPQIGFLLSAKKKYKDAGAGGVITDGSQSGDQSGSNEPQSYDIKHFYASSLLSWGLGAGYIHESGFGINARYNIGLSNTLKKTADGKIHSRLFTIGVIYMLESLKK
ncbi:MAG: porin family protein [Ginsengibacter sp.]